MEWGAGLGTALRAFGAVTGAYAAWKRGREKQRAMRDEAGRDWALSVVTTKDGLQGQLTRSDGGRAGPVRSVEVISPRGTLISMAVWGEGAAVDRTRLAKRVDVGPAPPPQRALQMPSRTHVVRAAPLVFAVAIPRRPWWQSGRTRVRLVVTVEHTGGMRSETSIQVASRDMDWPAQTR